MPVAYVTLTGIRKTEDVWFFESPVLTYIKLHDEGPRSGVRRAQKRI